MIVAKPYTQDFADIWNEFVKNSKAPMFMFERGYMDYHANRFKDASLLFYDESKLIAVLPATEHDGEIRSHGGLTYGGFISNRHLKQATMLDCLKVAMEYYRNLGANKILYKVVPYFYHQIPSQEDLYALYYFGGRVRKIEPATVIDLTNPCKISNGRRGHIAKARKSAIEVKETDDWDAFIELENQVLEARHNVSAVHTASELRFLKSIFPANIYCYGGYINGRMIAGTVLYVYDTVVHSQYMAASDEARRSGALDLVVAEQIERYKVAGKHYFDFGISSEDNGHVLNYGLISQKEDFGGRTVAYETWEIMI